VKYVSTRGEAEELGFEDVLLTGLARDGGLYVPERWPQLTPEMIAAFAGKPFHEVAAEVIQPFLGNAISQSELVRMSRAAYASFGHPAVTPLVQIGPNRFVLELFHGPTLAFKDVAMQLLARLMEHVLAKHGQRALMVGATSGDTGGAAIEAFRGAQRSDVVILFPDGRVSDVQRRMMTTPKEANVHAVAVAGSFDDCQARIKDLFNDHAFRDRLRLSAINSISWARIVAQVTYYFVAGVALGAPNRPIVFAVPTGNFGDIFAGYVARRMGLAAERLVLATNSNDILTRAWETGVYEVRDVASTFSPSMDIQVASNFERYLFEASGRDAVRIRSMMADLQQSGAFALADLRARMQEEFDAAMACEDAVFRCIRDVRARTGYLLDPHTACAVVALDRRRRRADLTEIVLATAHPAKFPDTMHMIAGVRPELPARLAPLMRAPERFTRLPNTTAAIKRMVESKAYAATRTQA
jgi:threonine synthase